MSTPVIAIVGRPNVGKSTLFNRISRRNRAIVADEPGVTRDRLYTEAELAGARVDLPVVIIDTGGFDPENHDPIMRRVVDQTQFAIDEADVVVFVTDGRAGLLPEDREIAKLLRRADKTTIVAVNKLDGEKQESLLGEFYELGMERTMPISAAHGRYIRDLEEMLVELLPHSEAAALPANDESPQDDEAQPDGETADDEEPPAIVEPTGTIRVAVIGRPNVGKSSLVNRLLGEDRHLVSDIAGTTVDTVDSLIERDGQEYRFIDTAGIRRKKSIAMRVEKFSVHAALRGLARSDVALLLLDATQPIADQDAKVSSLAFERGRAVILVVSKWDARPKDTTIRSHTEEVRRELAHLSYAPIVYTSANTGYGLDRLLPTVKRVAAQHGKRISTGELNRFVETMMDEHPPPTRQGKRARIYYVTQIGSRPPRFLVSVNNPKLIHFSYRRYLINQIRKKYGFEGVPLLVGYRSRTKKKK